VSVDPPTLTPPFIPTKIESLAPIPKTVKLISTFNPIPKAMSTFHESVCDLSVEIDSLYAISAPYPPKLQQQKKPLNIIKGKLV
jgi:hypothetical protein